MPTGYTSIIKDGVSFKKFALQCARAFGALIEMRDEPFDAKIPDEFKPSDYHIKALEDSKKKLEKLNKMTDAEIDTECEKDYQSSTKEFNKYNKEKLDLLAKYKTKLEEAKAWVPPTTEHQGLKDFMIQQITDSMKWDCDLDNLESMRPKKLTKAEYINTQTESLQWSVDYHTKKYAAEVKSCENRTKWIRDLKKSL